MNPPKETPMLTGTRTDVAADMERIFAPLDGRAAPRRGSVASVPALPRRGRSRAVLAAVAVAGAAAAAAIGYDLGTVPDVQAPHRDATIPHATRPAAPPQPVAQLAVPEPAPAIEAVPEAGSEPEPDFAPPADAVASAGGPAIAPPDVRPRASVRPDRRIAPARDTVRDDERCTGDECIYRDVLAADRRLRRAYDRAARAGVSSDWLAGVNRRWNRARDRAQDDPDGAIDRYDQLAEALDAERRELSR
jgi:hypothetical protein